MTLLKVEELSYQYGAHQVLLDVDFELEAGVVAALLGRNGAGKSTLLRCIAGWTMPERGTIELSGSELQTEEREVRRSIIFVPDTPDFYDEMTAWEHLQFVAQLHRIEDWQDVSLDLLEKFQLDDHRNAFPFTFSRGMRYKLALCMALLVNPPLLLLDEPFGPLDAVSVQFLWQHLQDYRKQGRSIIFSSHTLPEGGSPDKYLLLRDQVVTVLEPSQVTGIIQILSVEDEDEYEASDD